MRILIAILITMASLMFSSSATLPEEGLSRNETNLKGLRPGTDMLIIPLKNAGRVYMIEAIIDNQ
jgi:hypothetical protein